MLVPPPQRSHRQAKAAPRPFDSMKTSLRRQVCFAALCVLLAAGCGGVPSERDERLRVEGEAVTIATGHVGEQGWEFFTYLATSGRKVEFFVYRESSGEYRAALDACRKCYRWRKGYLIMGDGTIVCRTCGEAFEVDSLKHGRGACVPIPLTLTREGDAVFVPVSELEAGARYF